MTSALRSQIDFGFLSVPDWQDGSIEPDSMDHNAFSRSGSSSSQKEARPDQDAYVPINYISPEAYAYLVAAEAAAALRADTLEADGMDICAYGDAATPHCSQDGLHDPERILSSMAPPKKFYRTFWQSVSLRLLDRWASAARSAPIRQVLNLEQAGAGST